ncbi:MAG: hypothetical protein HGA31_05400 [Candidatus Moranbacteria bacterium]|nr:hypothetical protein [Candidatus Moranbacteria bacterium]
MMREVEEELAEDITKGRRIVLENLTGGFKKAAKEFWERNGVDLYDVETDWGRIAFVPAE